jgi:hypothetical protein
MEIIAKRGDYVRIICEGNVLCELAAGKVDAAEVLVEELEKSRYGMAVMRQLCKVSDWDGFVAGMQRKKDPYPVGDMFQEDIIPTPYKSHTENCQYQESWSIGAFVRHSIGLASWGE